MKLDLFCSKDDLREALQYVKVTKKVCVATDAHILGVVNTELIFDEEFIKKIPENGVFIHSSDWEELNKYDYFSWENEGVIRLRSQKSKVRDRLIETNERIKYPEWETVIPNEDMRQSVSIIGLNAELLATIQKAFGWDGCKLSFNDTNKAIYVEGFKDSFGNISLYSGAYAICMPIKVDAAR